MQDTNGGLYIGYTRLLEITPLIALLELFFDCRFSLKI